MKKSLLIVGLLLSISGIFAQAPNAVQYQGVARNSSGAILASQSISLQISLHDVTSNGTIIYRERHATSTNQFGVFTLSIGTGSPVLGTFSTITWPSAAKFLQIELDPTGGTTFTDMGTFQLLSVPYALYSNTAGSANSVSGSATINPSQINGGGATNNQVLQWNGTNWVPGTINTTVNTDNTLTGNGTVGTPLKLAQNGATTNQALVWNGTAWAPTTITNGDITDVIAGTGLSGGGTSGSVTLNATNTTAMWNANQIQGVNVTSGATTGQVLQYNGTNWAASTLSNYTPGTGLSLSGNTLNSIWTNSSNNVSNNTGNTLSFLTGSKPRMHIDANGDIGIGGNSTGAKLFLKHGIKSSFDSALGLANIYGQHILGDSVIAYNGTTPVGTIGQKVIVRKNMNLNLGTLIDVGSKSTNNSIYPSNYGIYSNAGGEAKNGFNLGGGFFGTLGQSNYGVYAVGGNSNDSVGGSNVGLYAISQGKGSRNSAISINASAPSNNNGQGVFGISSSISASGLYNYIMGYQQNIYTYDKGAYIHGLYNAIDSRYDSAFIYGERMDIRTSTAKGSSIYGHDLFASMESTGNLLGYDGDVRHSGINSQVYGFNQYVQLTGAGTIGFGYSADLRAYAKGNRNYAIDAYAQGSNNSDENYGVYSYATNGAVNYAGYFIGNVHVNGTLSKSSGSFKIDHPADPENKYLVHSFVESPDMMNIYNGNVVTDANGDATIIMPDYFEALNMDFRYQLTCMGVFAQAMVAQKIEGNRFVIKTDKPNVEVSWQVTGVRQDPWANAHRIEPVVSKSETERGTYLNPELYGKPETSRLGYHEPKKVEAVKPQIAPAPKVELPTVKSKP